MIVVAELAFNDDGHVPFNAGLLAVVKRAFPNDQIYFFGGSTHIKGLKKQSGKVLAESIEWKEVKLLPHDSSFYSRLFGEMKMMNGCLQMFPKGSNGHFLLTSARPATLLALKMAKYFRYKKIKAQIVLHGHLSGVTGKRYRNPLYRYQDMRTALSILGNSNLQYLVLEDHLREVLLQHLSVLSGKVEVLEHPLPPNEVGANLPPLSLPIRFGFIGLANKAKGFPVFVKLAESIAEKFGDHVEFHAIGRYSSEGNLVLRTDGLTTKPAMERLRRADYVRGVKQLHFIVLPHQESFYNLNSSGTLLDALAWGKPLIARNIFIFENFLVKHGDVGYLFRTDWELRKIVEDIVEKVDKIHYQEQVNNIKKARDLRSFDSLASEYRKICEVTEVSSGVGMNKSL